MAHGLQYLQGNLREEIAIDNALNTMRDLMPKCDLLENPDFQNFWGIGRGWWLEFQAMVTGITCFNGTRISESLAIQEFLNSDLVDEARFEHLRPYRGQILIPFGHNEEQEAADKYIYFMKKCCEILPCLGNVDVTDSSAISDNVEITTIEMEAAESERSETNLQIIRSQIEAANYHIQNVKSDGNCGFYTVLQCFHPDKDYEHVTQGDGNWQDAESLRRKMFPDSSLHEMVTGDLPTNTRQERYLPLDFQEARLAIYKEAQSNSKSGVIIINSTYDSNPTRVIDPINHMFMTINADGNVASYANFADALDSAGENPIVLLYTPNHWKAVIQNPSIKSSDKNSY